VKLYLGCDLGGTNLRAAVVDVDSGEVLSQSSTPTLAFEGHGAVMERMAATIKKLLSESRLTVSDVTAIGIGVPGVVDLDKGETVFLPNLPGTWPNVPLARRISELTGLPTAILNDVRSITYGEWKFGAGKGVDTVAVYAIGTGVGGGLVLNGQLYLGMGGTSGELGHMVIDHAGSRCGCGNYGCLETFASGPAIAAMGMKAVVQGLTTRIGELCGNDLNKITPALIARAAESGDEIACDIYEKVGYYLGVAASSICAAIGPQRIILAGGVSRAGRLLIEPMDRTMRERVHIMPVEKVEIVLSKLEENAGVIGAALWAETSLEQRGKSGI